MYIKIGGEYADREFYLLSELLDIIDDKIIDVCQRISISADPVSDGLTDRGEYFIGVGLSVIQQYLTDTLTLTGISKKRAFDIGPRYSKDLTFISIINAAANWWKHYPEWLGQESNNHLASRTQQIIMEVTDSQHYPLSNVLAELVGKSDITLSALLPNVVLWRAAVDVERRRNA